jgi:radical SAM protein with 4Fe4S-binding SPASM domain
MSNTDVSSVSNHLPDRLGLKRGAKNFPLMVVVAVSYVCNAKCPQCPYTQSDIRHSYKDTPFIAQSTFERIAAECGRHHSLLRITGGGEPLLHPKMVDMIEQAKDIGARVGLITNGSLLTSTVADRLLMVNTDAIEISVDAADEVTYAVVRKGLNFNRMLENVRYIVARRKANRSTTKIIVSIVNQEAIKDKLAETILFWKKIVDDVQVRKFLTWGIGDPEKSGDKKPYLIDRGKKAPCPFPFERLNVDSRGKIEFCGFDIAGKTDFGNVNDTTIESVWKGEKFNRWRQLLLDGKYEEIGICKECPDWKYRSWRYNYWNVLEKAEAARQDHLMEYD